MYSMMIPRHTPTLMSILLEGAIIRQCALLRFEVYVLGLWFMLSQSVGNWNFLGWLNIR